MNAPDLERQQRDRTQSTFIKFAEIDEHAMNYGTEDHVLIMNIASEPIDILWKNMGGTRGVYIFRRMFLYVVGFFIIIFISTPTAMLSTLKQVDIFGIFDFQWAENLLPLGSFFK
jgi:hypothetical protein